MQRKSAIKEKGQSVSEGQKAALTLDQGIFMVASLHGKFWDFCSSFVDLEE